MVYGPFFGYHKKGVKVGSINVSLINSLRTFFGAISQVITSVTMTVESLANGQARLWRAEIC